MPIYEYRCRKCGEQFEKIQKFSDAPLGKCEKCGGRLERLISPPAIQFKGSGWYVTDYARKGPATQDSGADKKDGASKGEAKTPAPAETTIKSTDTKPSSDK